MDAKMTQILVNLTKLDKISTNISETKKELQEFLKK